MGLYDKKLGMYHHQQSSQDPKADLGEETLEILLVEDSQSTRLILEKYLTEWGYSVTSCSNGQNAINLIKSQSYEVVITDWVMPEMDGMELISKIRQEESESFLYIIVLTALTKREDLLSAFEVGADDFLGKPLDYGELRARIRTASRIARLERQLLNHNRQLTKVKERMEKDLAAGAELQESLLPSASLERNFTLVESCFRPSHELAGDVFNYFPIEGSKVGLYLLDVSGHGVKASMLAVTLSRMLNPESPSSVIYKPFSFTGSSSLEEPEEVAAKLNLEFQIEKNNSQYFTMIYGILDTEERSLSFVCAGHPPLLVIKNDDSVQIIEGEDIPIGFSENYQFKRMKLNLENGDRCYLYSDGIIEAGSVNGRPFGMERMIEILTREGNSSLRQGMDVLVEEVKSWCNPYSCEDDISIVAIDILNEPETEFQIPEW